MNPLLPLLASLALVAPATADHTVVTTDKGAVRGAVSASGTRTFQGIPYAAPPTRWTSPQPATRWAGIRDAIRPGPACAQPDGLPIAVPSEAEDCLHLNVTTPAARRRHLPVIVWIHGGSMMFGAGHPYRAERLAADAVVVSINYRLGVLSFLTHPALDAGSPFGSGSLALEDQQAALRWVRTNISAFGGDPGNVTIMGQSGGGYLVCDHLVSPRSAGLFHRAIIQSAPCAGADGGTRTRAEAEADSASVITAVGCANAPDVAACLRSPEVTTAELLAAYDTWSEPRPVAGTALLPLTPTEAFRSGRFNRVPVMIGVNHDEENGRYGAAPPVPSYDQAVHDRFGAAADAVLKRYPLSDFDNSAELALATIGADHDWAVPTYDTARILTKWTPTHMFEFAERETPWFRGYPEPAFPWAAQHMAELAYLFDMDLFEPRTPAQDRLATRMVTAWTDFARSSHPGWHPLRPTWSSPSSPAARHPHIESLRTGPWLAARDFLTDHNYRFWSTLA